MVRRDPYAAFNFRVEIDGLEVAGFAEVSGLESETEVIEYREGNEIGAARKLNGLTKYPNIVLRRGVSESVELMEWRQNVIDGVVERRTLSIILLNESRDEVARWSVFEAWLSKWIGPTLDAISSAVAIETLEITHERIERA